MPYSALRLINLEVLIIDFIILYWHLVLLRIEFWVQVIKVPKSGGGGPGKPRLNVTAKNTTTSKNSWGMCFFTSLMCISHIRKCPDLHLTFCLGQTISVHFSSPAQGSKQLNCDCICFSHSEDWHFKQFNINFHLCFSVCSCWEVPLTFWKFGVLI